MEKCFALGQIHTTQFFNSVTHWAVHTTRFSGVLGVSHFKTRRRWKRSHYAILSIRKRNACMANGLQLKYIKDRIIVIFAHKLALYLVSFPESLEKLYVLNNSFLFYTSGGASAVSTEIAKP